MTSWSKGGGKEGQEFCKNITKISVIKSWTVGKGGGGGSKSVQKRVTSFMDDPLLALILNW